MPYILTALHGLTIIAAIIYIFKNNHERQWIFYISLFPFIGLIAFLIIVVLPELHHTKKGRHLTTVVNNTFNPNHSLTQALKNFDMNPCIANRMSLADALAEQGQYDKAISHYHQCLVGSDQNNPDILLKLASAQLYNHNASDCIDSLDRLREHNPSYNSPRGHLLYARALAKDQQQSKAIEEFEALIQYFSGYEAKARYAEYLMELQQTEKAQQLAKEIIELGNTTDRFAKEINAPWIKLAKQILRK